MDLPKNNDVVGKKYLSKGRCFANAAGSTLVTKDSPDAQTLIAAAPGIEFSAESLARYSNVDEFFGTITSTYTDGSAATV
jgi:hypothetical protein